MSQTIATRRREILAWVRVPENVIALVAAILLAVFVCEVKVRDLRVQGGDSVSFFQMVDSMAHDGTPRSQAFEATTGYLFGTHLLIAPAQTFATDPLVSPPPFATNPLKGHAYLILYLVAPFARIFPSNVVLLWLLGTSFVGLVLLVYLLLRRAGLPVAAGVLFCLLVVCHPAWSQPLLWGQFYPDRLFVPLGFGFMYLVSRNRTSNGLLIAVAVLAALVNERAALTCGGFLIAYLALYWRTAANRKVKLGLAAALFAYGWVLTTYVLVNPYYNNYFLKIGSTAFTPQAGLFVLVNLPLLLLAFGAPRAAVIAVLMMLPNLLGSVGGGEKTGWATHYHSYYFPALVWAALLGYRQLYARFVARGRAPALYALTAALALYLALLDPTAAPRYSFGPGNLSQTFVLAFPSTVERVLGPAGAALNEDAARADAFVPKGALVTTTESGMPLIYRDHRLAYFPLDIERADYAVFGATVAGGRTFYSGVVNYLGPAQQQRSNEIVVARMKRDGYDFEHALSLPAFGMIVVKRGR